MTRLRFVLCCFSFSFSLVFQFVHSTQFAGHSFFGSRKQARIHHNIFRGSGAWCNLPWAQGDEVVILQGKIKDKDANRGRDLFIVKKGFGSLPLFDGRVDKYDDRRFKVITFLEMEDNFRELSERIEKLTKMLEQEDLDAWEFEPKNWNASLMNDQNKFLCLNLFEALAMVKNMQMKTGVNGVACWWKLSHDCQALTGQRIQALPNAIYKLRRVKKYGR